MKPFRRISICLFLAVSAISLSSTTRAQDDKSEPEIARIEMLTARVLVLDPDGNPVEGATVFCSGMRTKNEPGSHWGWRPDFHGPLPRLKTNSDGIAVMPYPRFVAEKLETGAMTWSVEHPDFVIFREDRSVADEPAEIRLNRGFRIAVTAINSKTGDKIDQDLFALISGEHGSGPWKLHANGMLVSPVFANRESSLRIMQLIPGQPALFSRLISVSPDDRSRVLIRDVKLAPGTRLKGQLDESIDRPVKNGFVIGGVINSSAGNDWDNRWAWFDQVPIAEDGSFIFESLPSDEILQMVPICDGWVPGKPEQESILQFFPQDLQVLKNSSFTIPQLVELKGESVSAILKMEKSASLRVIVNDPQGKPLPGAVARMWPNQLWFDGGSQILGDGHPTRLGLVESRTGDIQRERAMRFSAKTNKQGIALIANLPPGAARMIAVHHDGFEMPISGQDRYATVELKSGQIAELTLQMQQKGTEVLGETDADDADD